MTTNDNTPAARAAISPHIVMLSVDPGWQARGGHGSAQKWNVTFDGKTLVSAERDPEHAACRALLALGITGRVTFIHAATGMAGLTMDIAKGAGRTATENDLGLRIRKFEPFTVRDIARTADLVSPATEVGKTTRDPVAMELESAI